MPGYFGIFRNFSIFSESIPKVKTITLIIFSKKIPENTEKKRKKEALKSRISSLSIVTYPQGITVKKVRIITEMSVVLCVI